MGGYREWATSDVVTAAEFQTLVQDQVIMVFADAAARDAAVSGANLIDGMFAYLTGTNTLTKYDGAAWVAAIASVVTDLTGTAWRVVYVDGSGNVVELALGALGTYLQSNSTTSAPTWVAIATTHTIATSPPVGAVAGHLWSDTTDVNNPVLKIARGTV